MRLVNELIDAFVDQEEIDFARQFTIPFPSQVILTLLGLPLEELPMLLRLKDGIIRPHHVVGTSSGDAKAAAYKESHHGGDLRLFLRHAGRPTVRHL